MRPLAYETLVQLYLDVPYAPAAGVRETLALAKVQEFIDSQAAAALDQIRRDFARSRTRLGLRPLALHEDKMLRLPRRFECPECGGPLIVEVDEWSSRDGTPTAGGYRVMCEQDTDAELAAWNRDEDYEDGHRHWQSDWQGVTDRVGKWMVRNVRVVPC